MHFVRSKITMMSSRSVFTSAVSNLGKLKDIPGPRRIPIWGNLYLYKLGKYKVEEYHKVLCELHKKYGPIVKQDFGAGNIVIHAFDPEDAKKVYSNEGPTPYVGPLQETTQEYRKTKNLSPGLGNTNGEEWYRLRSAVRKMMLRPKEVQFYLPIINQITDDLVLRLDAKKDKNGEILQLRDEIAKWSREASGWICFEKRLGALNGTETESKQQDLIDTNKKIFQLSSDLKFSLPIHKFVSTPKWKKLVKLEDKFHAAGVALVREAIENIKRQTEENQEENELNFLKYLLSRSELSDKDVEIITLSMFSDGLSTTVPSLMYNLYCLSANPEAQESVFQELSGALRDSKDITTDIFNNKLQYLKAAIKETFRLYPIGTEISRIVQSDHVLSDYHIPKGTHVHLNQFVHYKSEKYLKNPHQFLPERWLRDNENEIDPYLLVPFGHGTRTCAGRRFAEQDLCVALAKILLRFRLEYPKDEPPLEQVYRVLLFPKEPLRVRFVPRR